MSVEDKVFHRQPGKNTAAQPFFPHANNEAGRYHGNGMEVPDYGTFANKDWPGPEKGFAAMIRKLDNSVGMIK